LIVEAPTGQTVAVIYLGYDSLDIPLKPLRERGFVADADLMLVRLQSLTSKRLTPAVRSVRSSDALSGWSEITQVLDEITGLYKSTESNR
jgi:hypothetical protein